MKSQFLVFAFIVVAFTTWPRVAQTQSVKNQDLQAFIKYCGHHQFLILGSLTKNKNLARILKLDDQQIFQLNEVYSDFSDSVALHDKMMRELALEQGSEDDSLEFRRSLMQQNMLGTFDQFQPRVKQIIGEKAFAKTTSIAMLHGLRSKRIPKFYWALPVSRLLELHPDDIEAIESIMESAIVRYREQFEKAADKETKRVLSVLPESKRRRFWEIVGEQEVVDLSEFGAFDSYSIDSTFESLLLNLRSSAFLQRQIGFSETQKKQLDELAKELLESDVIGALEQLQKERVAAEGMPDYQELSEALNSQEDQFDSEAADMVQEVLAPTQIASVRQIATRAYLQKKFGTKYFQWPGNLSRQLELGEEQLSQLRSAENESARRFAESIEDFQAELLEDQSGKIPDAVSRIIDELVAVEPELGETDLQNLVDIRHGVAQKQQN